MKQFAAAILVLSFVGAVLARPEESVAAAAEQPAPVAEQPAAQPTNPIANIVQWLSKSSTRATSSLADRKKQTLAKIDALKAELQAKDKAIVVPSGPPNKRNEALALKAAIAGTIQELDIMRAEIMNMK